MVELAQFRLVTREVPVSPDTAREAQVLQVRYAEVVADPNGHLLVVREDYNRVIKYGEWHDLPIAKGH